MLKAIGVAGVASVLPAGSATALDLGTALDETLDTTTDSLQEILVVFETVDDIELLDTLPLPDGYFEFETLPIAYTRAPGTLLETIADLPEVLSVVPNRELEYYNDDARATTNAQEVQAGEGVDGYTGENVHSVVIDSGVDGLHPDLTDNLVANWRWIGDPLTDDGETTLWVDAGPINTDDNGHGTHCSGTVAGNGTQSEGEFSGMAPDADLTVYSAGLTLLLVKVVAAYDHMISEKRDGETDVQVVSNSYGITDDSDFDPDMPENVATWEALQENILPVFAAGNSGPETNTLNALAQAPNVLGVAATHADQSVAAFSSRGRSDDFDGESNYDREKAYENLETYRTDGDVDGPLGLYRNGIGAKGADVVSTMNPAHPLQAVGDDTELFYGSLDGTSMSCPAVAGCATLVIDAYIETHGAVPDSIDVLNTLEATADLEAIDDVDDPDGADEYTAENIGTGYVDALAAVQRTEKGDLAGFGEAEIAPSGGDDEDTGESEDVSPSSPDRGR